MIRSANGDKMARKKIHESDSERGDRGLRLMEFISEKCVDTTGRRLYKGSCVRHSKDDLLTTVSLQPFRQVFGLQMGVPFQHLQRLMSGDRRHFHDIESFFKQPACRLMPKVVKI